MSRDHKLQPDIEASLAPFFAAARRQHEAPLDPALAERLTAQALALIPQETARAPQPRRQALARLGNWLDRLLAPAGLASAAAAAGLAGLAIGFWAPGFDGVSGAVLAWIDAPQLEPGLPWEQDAGLMALIDGQGG